MILNVSFDGAKLLLPRNNNSANLYVEKHIYGGGKVTN